MNLFDLIVKGLLRTPARSIFFIIIMMLATAFYGGLNALTEGAEDQLQQGLATQENRLTITPGSDQMILHYGGFPIHTALSYRGRDLPYETLEILAPFVEQGKIIALHHPETETFTRIEAQASDRATMLVLLQELENLLPEATVVPIRDVEEGRQTVADQMALFRLYLLAVTTLAIAALVTAFTNLSVQERMREMTILGALGFSRRALKTLLLGEIIILALIGTLGGLVLGFWGATVVADLGATAMTTGWSLSNIIGTITPLLLATLLGGLLSLRLGMRRGTDLPSGKAAL
ncbi:ABC transporter permease [Heliorestis convoluta]|uniref:FtsX-like permease family protein n=1 Tax=Heliorestis convoluta TaxID=356322 RepID=A0A5Q2MXK0_9FIRM|nr:ABC transporter permease [Heliorestis convoluta]QGG47454.1 ftsX-like permease family protein [Heliorestis convoluta]